MWRWDLYTNMRQIQMHRAAIVWIYNHFWIKFPITITKVSFSMWITLQSFVEPNRSKFKKYKYLLCRHAHCTQTHTFTTSSSSSPAQSFASIRSSRTHEILKCLNMRFWWTFWTSLFRTSSIRCIRLFCCCDLPFTVSYSMHTHNTSQRQSPASKLKIV